MNSIASTIILILLLLASPIAMTMTNYYKTTNFPSHVTSLIKLTFWLSLVPMCILFHSNTELLVTNWHWLTINTIKLSINLKFDFFCIIFLPVALFVTWSIMEFSSWYMHSDPHLDRFIKYLLIFLITMIILTSANNMFQLFIGWEGVGVMSFLLIAWWYARPDANTAALQAVLYNRIGDIGFIATMAWLCLNNNSWEFQQIFMMDNKSLLPLLGLLIAAAGKSAQFGLHPWLPSAMEGPTPVSALLHSSTMVVAGIFLLIRFHPMMSSNNTALTMMLCIGSLTTLFTAICALTQNDIKKIVAFSTSSQLGLMMVTLGINQPYLAFLHICTHAFFKAMLFLCSGSIIHSLNDEQDIRKMGGLLKALPFTSSCLTIGSLALTGVPFLTGFYSKDLIIEAANTCYTNAWALLITLLATSLTAVYSMRIIFFALMSKPRFTPLITLNENNPTLINPIKRLALGSMFAGYIIFYNIPITTVQVMTMPWYLKTAAMIITILGFSIALELNNLTLNLKTNFQTPQNTFSTSLGFFTLTLHRLLPAKYLTMSFNTTLATLDLTWLEKAIPKTISLINTQASQTVANQKGLIKLYFLSFLITLLTVPTLIISFPE
nr:NADH dehydrogenase subunit 5 [Cricetus cricetus]